MGIHFPGLICFEDDEDEPSGIVFFMIVSLPEDAADTICCSIDLLILTVKFFCKAACFIKMSFLGGIVLCPFFVLAAACRAFRFVDALVCRPFVFP